MAFTENPIVEGKQFKSVSDNINENFTELKTVIEGINEIVFGTYTGNFEIPSDSPQVYSGYRMINLGFTPICVELWNGSGSSIGEVYNGDTAETYTATAIKGVPANFCGRTLFSIVDGGIQVKEDVDTSDYVKTYTQCNTKGRKYYFKAYKDTKVPMEIVQYE